MRGDKQIIDSISLKDREFYNYYKKNRKKTAKGIYQFEHFEKAVGGLMLALHELIVESEGGVFIENLGYFAVFETLKKTVRYNMYDSSLKSFIPAKRYYPYFFGDVSNTTFKNWTMNKTFSYFLVLKVRNQIKAGKKYKLFYSAVKKLKKASLETRQINNRKNGNKT